MIPLFLFSGTFFPIAQLPVFLQPLAVVTPLWHGVDLCRTLALGTADAAGVLIHVAYLGTLTAVGLVPGAPGLPPPARAVRASSMTLIARVTPPVLFGGRRAGLLIERNLMVYRRGWLVIVSGFFEPLFYLLSIGLGIGALVGAVPLGDGRVIPYTAFVAPALLASSAMNGAIYDSTFNVFFKLKYAKTYDAILATPVGVGDVAARRDRLGADPRRDLRRRRSCS